MTQCNTTHSCCVADCRFLMHTTGEPLSLEEAAPDHNGAGSNGGGSGHGREGRARDNGDARRGGLGNGDRR